MVAYHSSIADNFSMVLTTLRSGGKTEQWGINEDDRRISPPLPPHPSWALRGSGDQLLCWPHLELLPALVDEHIHHLGVLDVRVLLEHVRQIAPQGVGVRQLVKLVISDGPRHPPAHLHIKITPVTCVIVPGINYMSPGDQVIHLSVGIYRPEQWRKYI